MKTVHNEYWNYDTTEYELSDYKEGDMVEVKPRSFSSGTKLPLYLNHSILKVEKICRKNIKLSYSGYPGEYFFAAPNEIMPAK